MKYSLVFFLALLNYYCSSGQVSQKYFGKSGFSGVGMATAVLNDSNRIIVGSKLTSSGDNDAFISCINKSDSVLWSKEISTANHDRFMAVTPTSDGGCVAVGYVYQSLGGPYNDNQAAVYKFDAGGNILWKKIFKATSHGEIFFGVVEIPGSNNIVCAGLYDFGNPSLNGGLIVNLSSTGSINWAKKYYISGGNEIHGIKYLSGKLICSGFYYGGSTYYDGNLFAVQESDGTSLWSRGFDYTSTISSSNNSNFMDNLNIVDSKIYIDGFLASSYGTSNCFPSLISFDTTGLNPKVVEYPLSGFVWSNTIHSKVVSASEIYLFQNASNDKWDKLYCYSPIKNISDVVITKIKDLSNPSMSKVYTRTFGNTGNQALVGTEFKNGKITGVGSAIYDPVNLVGNQDIFKVEFDTALPITSTNCIVNVSGQLFGNPVVTLNTAKSFASITNVSFLTVPDPTVTSVLYTSATPCAPPIINTITPNFNFTKKGCKTVIFKDLTTTSHIGIKYWLWYFGDGDTSTLKNPEHEYALSGTYNVKLIVTDSTGKKDSVTKVVIININSLINVTASPKEIVGCNGDEIQLNASGAKYYEWSPAKGLTDNKIANPRALISGSVVYIVTGIDSNGCTDMDTVLVTGNPNPKVQAISDNLIVNCTTNVVLSASGALQYSWTPAVYAESNFSSSTKVYPPATTVFTVRGWDENGCYSEDTITVFYDGKSVVKIPNAFTPNNDQINDKISPIYICDFVLTEFSIYNRWGNMVFTTNTISTPWDGTFKGKECEMGSYFYLLKGKNHKEEEVFFKGDITLIR